MNSNDPDAQPVADYTRPPRCPDTLLTSDLPDWAVRVWLAVRSAQGNNDSAWAGYEAYASRAGKSYAMVRKAVTLLKKTGWIVELEPAGRSKSPVLRCSSPEAKGENTIPAFADKGGNTIPKRREQGSKPPTPPIEEESVQESVKRERPPSWPTLEEVLRTAAMIPVPPQNAEEFFWHFEAQEWETSAEFPRPVKRSALKAHLQRWKVKGYRFDRTRGGSKPAAFARVTTTAAIDRRFED